MSGTAERLRRLSSNEGVNCGENVRSKQRGYSRERREGGGEGVKPRDRGLLSQPRQPLLLLW